MIVALSYLTRVQSEPLAGCRQVLPVRLVQRVSRSAGLGGPKGAFRRKIREGLGSADQHSASELNGGESWHNSRTLATRNCSPTRR